MPRSLPRLALALVPTLLLAGPAGATVVAGFEAGLGGVTTVGNAYVVDGSFGAGIPEGLSSLFLSTFPNGDFLLGPLTGSAIEQTLPPAVATATLETFLGLAAGDLDAVSPSNPTVEGSAAQLSFTIAVPMDLHLDFILLSNETDAWAPTFTDFFFTTLTGESAVEHRSVVDPLVASPGTVFDRDSGWLSVDWVGLAPGSYTLGFGIVDVQDSDLGTAVLVDNISLVPEPRIAAMLFFGLGGIWVAGRPRRPSRRAPPPSR
jgi:hypothetical protein